MRQAFRLRQSRQILAITATFFLVLFLAAIYKRPDIFGTFSKGTIFAIQGLLISVFIGFTVVNWRCPSCKRYMGSDINKRTCRKCGIRLQ